MGPGSKNAGVRSASSTLGHLGEARALTYTGPRAFAVDIAADGGFRLLAPDVSRHQVVGLLDRARNGLLASAPY
jgi:hypothetical protein